jgi:hypothetical protein
MCAHLACVARFGTESMQSQPPSLKDLESAHIARAFVPLDLESRSALDTETAAYHLSREPQTLRVWACRESGPLRPLRINGRLAWRTADLRALLGMTA